MKFTHLSTKQIVNIEKFPKLRILQATFKTMKSLLKRLILAVYQVAQNSVHWLHLVHNLRTIRQWDFPWV